MKYLLFLTVSLMATACTSEGIKTKPVAKKVEPKVDYSLDREHQVVDTKLFDNGIMIEWYERGDGEKVKAGDLLNIDYKVRLKDGDIVDGNHLIKKETFPFLVGFEMQTKGWDLAIREMNVGDFARIRIPAELARGEKGVPGLIPPNADNFLSLRIVSKQKPNRTIDGVKVWVLEENKKNKDKFSECRSIVFHAMVSSPSNPMYANTFRTNQPFTFILGDYGLVPGLKKALINAKSADRMYVLVPASEAYGDKGYLDIVKPNEDLFYNIFVMDVLKK
jgi:FKBP-type peptidyl-prolyl cis-trans isomerase